MRGMASICAAARGGEPQRTPRHTSPMRCCRPRLCVCVCARAHVRVRACARALAAASEPYEWYRSAVAGCVACGRPWVPCDVGVCYVFLNCSACCLGMWSSGHASTRHVHSSTCRHVRSQLGARLNYVVCLRTSPGYVFRSSIVAPDVVSMCCL